MSFRYSDENQQTSDDNINLNCIPSDNCISTAYQHMRVNVPVSVKPVVYDLPATIHCCGDPCIKYKPIPCKGNNKSICSFVLTQDLCLEIPIVIGANTMVGNPFVNCGIATNGDICTDCETELGNTPTELDPPKLHNKSRIEKHWSSPKVI